MSAVDDPAATTPVGDPDLLRESIESLAEGLAIFGADFRLIVSNRRYAEMLHPVADLIVPGALWQDLLRACAERRVYKRLPTDVEEWIERMGREPWTRLQDVEIEQTDGRIYSASYRPTNFGGFVITRIDITERRRAEAMIRDREALLATVLDTIPVAIVMARTRRRADHLPLARGGEAVSRRAFLCAEPLRERAGPVRLRGGGRDAGAGQRLPGRPEARGRQRLPRLAVRPAGGIRRRDLRRLGDQRHQRDARQGGTAPACRRFLPDAPDDDQARRPARCCSAAPRRAALFGDPATSKVLYVEPEARERYVEELREKGAVHEYLVQLRKANGDCFWSASSSRADPLPRRGRDRRAHARPDRAAGDRGRAGRAARARVPEREAVGDGRAARRRRARAQQPAVGRRRPRADAARGPDRPGRRAGIPSRSAPRPSAARGSSRPS